MVVFQRVILIRAMLFQGCGIILQLVPIYARIWRKACTLHFCLLHLTEISLSSVDISHYFSLYNTLLEEMLIPSLGFLYIHYIVSYFIQSNWRRHLPSRESAILVGKESYLFLRRLAELFVFIILLKSRQLYAFL